MYMCICVHTCTQHTFIHANQFLTDVTEVHLCYTYIAQTFFFHISLDFLQYTSYALAINMNSAWRDIRPGSI